MRQRVLAVLIVGGFLSACAGVSQPDPGPLICPYGTPVNGVCVPNPPTNYDGSYKGRISGTKTVPGFAAVSVSSDLTLNVATNQLRTVIISGEVAQPLVNITDSISGVSQIITWPVVPINGPADPCTFHMTGTFRTSAGLGKTASGSFTYDGGNSCSGGGTWQASTN